MTTSLSGLMVRFKQSLPLLALLALMSPLAAKNLPDPQAGCQLNVPDDWTVNNQTPAAGYSVVAVKADHSKAVALYVKPVDATASIDDNSDLIKGIEDGFQKSGGTVVSREHKKINGISFYVLTGTATGGKGVTQSVAWVTVASGRMYQICLYELNGDPAKDPELTAAIHSFALTAK